MCDIHGGGGSKRGTFDLFADELAAFLIQACAEGLDLRELIAVARIRASAALMGPTSNEER